MTYALKTDMQTALGDDELIQLTDRDTPPLNVIDDTVLTRALQAADGEIDSYIGGRYSLPLAIVPTILRDAAIDIARYRLHDRGASDLVTDNYKGRIAWLRDVAAGKASLGLPLASTPASGIGAPEMTSGGRIFGRETS